MVGCFITKKKKTWGDIPISEILGNISEEKKKSFFIILFFSTIHAQPSHLRPAGGGRAHIRREREMRRVRVAFFILFYFILFYKSSFPRVLEQNAGICRA